MVSFLDGYSGYNQVLVNYEDCLKTMFTTKWGTFAYQCMSFSLINIDATFQREMDTVFKELIGKCIIIYMDDLTMFSKRHEDHPNHLCKIFERCQKYEISLNPKTCIFGVSKGKLLGHVIYERGISIDPNKVEALLKLQMPGNKKEMWSYFRKINFVRKFIVGFTEIIKTLNDMMKNDAKLNGVHRPRMCSIKSSSQ